MNNLLLNNSKENQCFSQLDSYYILQNSWLNKYSELDFNISGQLEGENNNLNIDSNNDLILSAKKLNDEVIYEMDCKIYYITGNNYTLNCNLENKTDCELDNSMACVNNQLLLINFGNNPSNITFNETVEVRKYYKNKSNGLSGGAIAAIVIASVAALAAIIGVIYYLKKNKSHPEIKNSFEEYNSSSKINN